MRLMAAYSYLRFAVVITTASPLLAWADNGEETATHLQQQQWLLQQQREKQIQQQNQQNNDVRLNNESETPTVNTNEIADDELCFHIDNVVLTGESAKKFQFALHKALKQTHFQAGQCLGTQGVNRLMTLAQNALIAQGYTTTRVLAAPQDLKSGTLNLTVLPGRLRKIHVDVSNPETHAERIAAVQNEFPIASGKILNLRALEQGLENLKRVPTAEADIQIVPADAPDESDVLIKWQQRTLPFRFSASLDDSGSKSTGKYQGSFTFSMDNPLGLSDLLYFSYNRDLGHRQRLYDSDGHKNKSRTNGYAFHYSVPWGKWLWSLNYSGYRYHQAVAGDSQNYDYNGKSSNSDISVSRLLYRDAARKTHINAKFWQRETQSFIDDAEIDVQKRRSAGWSLGFEHKEYLNQGKSLTIAANYKRGTERASSLPAPEQEYGEGTSRMRIITADIGLALPFAIGKQQFSYESNLHAQWNKTPLTPQDKIAIGGRYSVRGFDGEMSLAAERGWYSRNELAWQYVQGHQIYLAVDGGHVSGRSMPYLLGQSLVGAAIGVKGQFKAGGALSYDVFIGRPIRKPSFFRTAKNTAGLSLSWSF